MRPNGSGKQAKCLVPRQVSKKIKKKDPLVPIMMLNVPMDTEDHKAAKEYAAHLFEKNGFAQSPGQLKVSYVQKGQGGMRNVALEVTKKMHNTILGNEVFRQKVFRWTQDTVGSSSVTFATPSDRLITLFFTEIIQNLPTIAQRWHGYNGFMFCRAGGVWNKLCLPQNWNKNWKIKFHTFLPSITTTSATDAQLLKDLSLLRIADASSETLDSEEPLLVKEMSDLAVEDVCDPDDQYKDVNSIMNNLSLQ